jgi:non-ribosomal peptide synthetase component F
MQTVPRAQGEFPEMVIRPLDQEITHARFDLALFVSESPRGLSGSVVYSTDLFKEAMIAKMMSNYEVLLHDIVTRPESAVDNLEIQSTSEKEEEEIIEQNRALSRKRKLRKIDRTEMELN